MSRTMPVQKPGRSVQSVRTPDDFLIAVQKRLGVFWIDLAATYCNRVRPDYYSLRQNSLLMDWKRPIDYRTRGWNQDSDWGWCNPPYSDIEPWVRKGLKESERGAMVAMLLPASVGSNWWRDFVHQRTRVLLLNGRLTFKGHRAPYPKDLVLVLFNQQLPFEYEVWSWRTHGLDSLQEKPL